MVVHRDPLGDGMDIPAFGNRSSRHRFCARRSICPLRVRAGAEEARVSWRPSENDAPLQGWPLVNPTSEEAWSR